MAYVRVRFCSHPGCTNKAVSGSYYCEQHQRKKYGDRTNGDGDGEDRRSTTKFQYMYNRKWKGASRQWLAMPEHSWCEKCGKPSELVHHKIEHNGDWGLFWDRSNWQALCWSCHSKLHMEERNRGK